MNSEEEETVRVEDGEGRKEGRESPSFPLIGTESVFPGAFEIVSAFKDLEPN